MSRKIITEDGATFEGEDARDLVRQMRDAGWQHYDRKRDYMEDVSSRIEQMTGEPVRTFAEGFIEDIIEAGLAREVE